MASITRVVPRDEMLSIMRGAHPKAQRIIQHDVVGLHRIPEDKIVWRDEDGDFWMCISDGDVWGCQSAIVNFKIRPQRMEVLSYVVVPAGL